MSLRRFPAYTGIEARRDYTAKLKIENQSALLAIMKITGR